MKRAALYIRVSTTEQAQEGYSIGEQKERLIAYCKAHDWIIAEIYVDGGYTGSNLKRPGIQKLITEIDKFDIVLVYKLDRLSRSQRDTLHLIEEIFLPNNIDFISMQESFDTSSPFGKAMIGLLAVFAQLEREQIKERTWMGRIARAKLGLYHGGGKVPIGYDYAKTTSGHLVVNPYEAEQVQKMYKWYLEGASCKAILKRLQDEGYTTKYGNYTYNWATIRNILGNALYIGRMRFGDLIVENAHEAIISPDQFAAVQFLREKRRGTRSKSSTAAKYLLVGLMFCGYCGARIAHKYKTSSVGYYCCYSRAKQSQNLIKDPNCKNKIWRDKKLEAIIVEQVQQLFQSPKSLEDIIATRRKQNSTTKHNDKGTIKRINEIDKQINKLMELYQLDDIPVEILGNRINKLYAEKNSLQASLEPEQDSNDMSFDLAQELIADAAQIWDFTDTAQKRTILQSLISRIVLTGDEVKIEWNF